MIRISITTPDGHQVAIDLGEVQAAAQPDQTAVEVVSDEDSRPVMEPFNTGFRVAPEGGWPKWKQCEACRKLPDRCEAGPTCDYDERGVPRKHSE